MVEAEILNFFINLKDPLAQKWIVLIRESIHFTPKEKAMFIMDFRDYQPEQLNEFIKALERSKERDVELKEKFPEKYQQRVEWFTIGWKNMIEYLEEVATENKGKKASELDDRQVKDIRQQIEDKF